MTDILTKCGVKRPPVRVESIAKVLGIKVQMQPFKREKGKDLSGILIREGAKAILGVNSNHHEHRRRFTTAHEIGHFLLHEGDRVFVDRAYKVNLRNTKSSLGVDLEEIEANTFASMLLIPEPFLVEDIKEETVDMEDTVAIARLARKYRISLQAMTFRLANRL